MTSCIKQDEYRAMVATVSAHFSIWGGFSPPFSRTFITTKIFSRQSNFSTTASLVVLGDSWASNKKEPHGREVTLSGVGSLVPDRSGSRAAEFILSPSVHSRYFLKSMITRTGGPRNEGPIAG